MTALGIEFSTQSVKLIVLDIVNGAVVFSGSFSYDEALPHYGTNGGVLPGSDPSVRHTSPFMMLEAMDRAFETLLKEGVDPLRIAGMKVDAMQHCTVYTDGSFAERVSSLNTKSTLLEQIGPSFTRKSIPIWEDRSTAGQVELLNRKLSGSGGIEALCGNSAEPRFPAAQILKWAVESPPEYRATSRVFLLSAFLTSLLTGKPEPVDTGDGWGTNLNSLNIENPGWDNNIIESFDLILKENKVTGSIKEKIGGMVPCDAPLGNINPYFTARYGINPEAIVLAGTGDNPATLLGSGGNAVISLGSSYTVNGIAGRIEPSPSKEYNLFGYIPDRAMALSVFTNGSKLHDKFKEKYSPDGSFDSYTAMAGGSDLSENEPLMLPWLFDESLPRAKRGIVRQNFDETDPGINVRSLHISQALALRLHSEHLARVPSICVAGGAASNSFLRQLISDLFRAETWHIENSDYCAPMGCAISAARRILGINYDEAAERFIRRVESSVLKPLKENSSATKTLLKRYEDLEKKYLMNEISNF